MIKYEEIFIYQNCFYSLWWISFQKKWTPPQKREKKKNQETLMILNGHSITFLLNAHSIWQTASPPNHFANHSWNFYSLLNPVQFIKYQSTLLNVPVAINLPTQPFAHNSLESKHFIAYLIFFLFYHCYPMLHLLDHLLLTWMSFQAPSQDQKQISFRAKSLLGIT